MMKKAIALLLVLALLTGCAPAGGTNSGASSPAQSGAREPAEAPPTASPEQMRELAELFEASHSGGSLGEGEVVRPSGGIAFELLLKSGLVEPYKNPDGAAWDVPYPTLAEINSLFFPKVEPLHADEKDLCVNYSTGYNAILPYALTEQTTEELPDGTVRVTYRRESETAVLTPVTYHFRPYWAGDIPEALKGIYQTGDILCQIVSVTQRPDLLPEIIPATIEISTVEELLAAVQRINEGRYQDQNNTYLLTADLDLAGVEWTPIGMNNPALEYWYEDTVDPYFSGFTGTFDGQGHTVYNLTITEEQGKKLLGQPERNFPQQTVSGAGFFYRISSQGTVKNLTLENAAVHLPLQEKIYGVSAGLLAADCGGRLQNISVQGSVQAISEVGGLVGRLSGSIAGGEDSAIIAAAENCTADVTVTGYSEVGGLTGTLYFAEITGCTVKGTVTAVMAEGPGYKDGYPHNIGGMMGHCLQGTAINCHAGADVFTQSASNCVGSFCGLAEGGVIRSCTEETGRNAHWESVDAYYRMDQDPEIERK